MILNIIDPDERQLKILDRMRELSNRIDACEARIERAKSIDTRMNLLDDVCAWRAELEVLESEIYEIENSKK
jgi:hypothetical protein